jgi:hypothetical protein
LGSTCGGPEVTEFSERFRTRLWAHLSVSAIALANVYDDTPRTILEEAFKHVPGDEQWRADVERRLRELRRYADEQGD